MSETTVPALTTPPMGVMKILPSDKSIYFNGTAVGYGAAGDFVLTLFLNGNPILTLNTSVSVGKSLLNSLTKVIQNFERNTGQSVLTTEELAAILSTQDDSK